MPGRRLAACAAVAGLVVVGLALAAEPSPTLADVSMRAPKMTTGEQETWTFAFTAQDEVATGGKIRVDLPTGSLALDSSSCDVTKPDIAGEVATVSEDGQRVECTLAAGGIAAGDRVFMNLTRLDNPSTAGTREYTIKTLSAVGSTIDESGPQPVTVAPHLFLQASPLKANALVAGTASTYWFNFTLYNLWETNGWFRLSLPGGYTLNASGSTMATLSTATDSEDVPLRRVVGTTVWGKRVGVAGAPFPGGTGVMLRLTNLGNPSAAGVTGPFGLATMDGAEAEHDHGAWAGVTLSAPPPPSGGNGPPTGGGGDPDGPGGPGGEQNPTGSGASNGPDAQGPGGGRAPGGGSSANSASWQRAAGIALVVVGAAAAIALALWGAHQLGRRRG